MDYQKKFVRKKSDITNFACLEDNPTFQGIVPSVGLNALRRCNSLPIIVSKKINCDWGKNNTQTESICSTDESVLKFESFNYKTTSKSLQILQTEVEALIKFRNIVIETFPYIKRRIMSMHSTVSTSQRNQLKKKRIRTKSQIYINSRENSINKQSELVDENLQSFVSHRRIDSNLCKKEPKSADGSGSTVQDSGFSTETICSKDGYVAPMSNSRYQGTNISNRLLGESDDELFNLLDVIFRKTLPFRHKFSSVPASDHDHFETYVSPACIQNILGSSKLHPTFLRLNTNHLLKDNLLKLSKERDKLLLNVAQLETEIRNNRMKILKMEKQMEFLTSGNNRLEDQLKSALNQNGGVNPEVLRHNYDRLSQTYMGAAPAVAVGRLLESECQPCVRGHNLNFTTRTNLGTDQISSRTMSEKGIEVNSSSKQLTTSEPKISDIRMAYKHLEIKDPMPVINLATRTFNRNHVYKNCKYAFQHLGKLDGILSSPKCLLKARETNSNKIAAILLEANPLELQRHLLMLTVKNQIKRSLTTGPTPISLSLKSKTSQCLGNQLGNSFENNDNHTCSVEQFTNFKNLPRKNHDQIRIDTNIDSNQSHRSNIQSVHIKGNVQSGKKPKPSKIPLFGPKKHNSSEAHECTLKNSNNSTLRAMHKSIKLRNINFITNSGTLNEQDSISSQTRKSEFGMFSKPDFCKINQEAEEFQNSEPLQNDSTDKHVRPTKQLIVRNKHLNFLSPPPRISFFNRNLHGTTAKATLESNKNNLVARDDTKSSLEILRKNGYPNQPIVQLLFEDNSFGSSDSRKDKETFNNEDIGRVSNLRSTLMGWLKI